MEEKKKTRIQHKVLLPLGLHPGSQDKAADQQPEVYSPGTNSTSDPNEPLSGTATILKSNFLKDKIMTLIQIWPCVKVFVFNFVN